MEINRPSDEPNIPMADPRHAQLESALATLNEDERQAVLLLRGYGMKPREASLQVGASVETLKKRAFRAMQKLRGAFGITIDKSVASATAKDPV